MFSGLSSLTQLWLNTNSLNELPAGLFSGLSSLTTLDLLQNDRILPLIVSLEKVGAAGVRAVAPAGAPFALTLPVVVANGALAGGATTLAIAAGEVATEAVTVVPGNTGAVTVDLGTPLPRLPSGHQGYAITRAATGLPVTTQAATTCTLNQGDLWCGVVTVDPVAVTGLTNGHGYSDAGSAGDLTVPRGFTAGPDTYTINTVATGAFDGGQGLLFSLDSGLTAAVSSSLELHVRGDQFAFSDSADVPQAGVYFWPTSQDWSSEPSVTLTLRGLASMDATLSDLAVSDGGSDLLTFASGTTTYTAMVANDVATVTFTATKNDAGASVEYLDADGNVLADADTTEDGFQVVLEVALAVGANAITVRVTAENGTPVQDYTVTVTRAEGPPTVTVAAALTVTVAVSQTGSVLQDASAVPSSVTFAADAATATLALATNDDDTDDDDGTVTVTLGADTGYQVGTPGAATVAVSDNDVPVDFVLAVPATVAEDAGTATVTVTATTAENAPPATPVEVQLARVGGTATGGTDYDAVSVTARFQVSDFAAAMVDGQPRYQAEWTHDVVIHDDEVVEDDETVVLEMSPTSAFLLILTLQGGIDAVRKTLTIVDNDLPVVTIAADADVVGEDSGAAGFTLSRTGPTAASLTVTVAVTPEADRDLLPDGAAAQRTVTFAAGSATTTLTVTLDDDDLAETSGTLTVQVQEGDGYTVGTPSSAAVTITDGDTGTLQPAGLAASAGPRAGEVVLTWDAVALWLEFRGHQYRYKTDGGYGSWTDIPDSGPRQANGTGWSVSGLAAGQVHTFQVRAYETPAVGDPVYGVASDEVSATPLAGQVTLHLSGVNNATLEGGTVTVTAMVAPASATAFTVTVTASPVAPATDGDFELSTNQELSFAADATDSTGTVTIRLVDDDLTEPNDVVTVSGAVSDAAITAPADVTLTIANDDDDEDVRYDVAVTAPATVDEDAGTADVTVTLTTTQNSAPTIGPFLLYQPKPETATPDADYTPPPKVGGVVTTVPVAAFSQNAAGTAYVAQATFTIGIVDDSLDEADETIVFEVSTAKDKSPAHTLTITDNDDPPVVSVEDETAAEGDPLEFTVALSAVSGREVTVDWATSVEAGDTATAGTDFTAANDTLTFMPGDTTATFTVQTTEDTTGEANETFTVTLSNPSNATLATDPTATGTITNDDTPAVSFGAGTYSVDEGGTVEVTVQLDAAPGREVVVPVSAAGAGGATPQGETGADWSGVPENVTFGATDTAQTFTLAATDDADVDPGESVALSFGTLPAGVTAGTPSEATVTIVDNDAADAVNCTLDTGDLWCGVVTVGTSSDGVGFVAADPDTDPDVGALTDNNGDQTITIGSDSYTISSLLVRNSPAGALSIDLDKSFPTDDVATLEFYIGTSTKTFKVSEATAYATDFGYFWTDSGLSWSDGGPDVTLRLRRAAAAPDAPIDFTATAGDAHVALAWKAAASDSGVTGYEYRYKTGGDYPANWTPIANSGLDEANESGFTVKGLTNGTDYTFELRAVIGDVKGDTVEQGPVTPMAAVVLAELSVAAASASEGDPVEFTVTLSPVSGREVTVEWATSVETGDNATAGTDFTAASDTLTFMPGDTTATFTVQTTADTVDEDDETFTVTLSNPSSSATLATDPTATGTIRDDDTAPTIDRVAVTSTPVLTSSGGSTPDTYGAGETIEVSVIFNQAVTATTGTDFELSVAGAKGAPLLRGSGTATLVFGYTVPAGASDTDGIWIGDQDRTLVGNRNVNPQTGTITSVASGVEADLTHAELGMQSGHKVDGSRSIVQMAVTSTPLLTSSGGSTPDTYGGAGETIRFTVTFNVAVDVTGDPVFTFELGNSGAAREVDAAYESGSGTAELVFGYAVVSTDMDGNGISLVGGSDLAGRDSPVDLDTDDSIRFTGTGTDVPLAWPTGSGTQSRHKVNGSRSPLMDATLRALVVNDGSTDLTLTPDFAPDEYDYTASSVVNAVDEVTVTAKKNDAGARIEYRDASDMPLDDADSAAGHQVAVAEGDTVIKVRVTAEDRMTVQDYTVTVNRSALPTLSVADASAVEGSAVTFTVTLSKAATQNLTATWTASLEMGDTAAAADFTDLPAATGTVTVIAGRRTATFPVATAQDTTDEENETFTVTLSNLSNAELAADPTATGTITDDDEAMTTLSVADASAREGDQAAFTVTLSAVSGRTVTVRWRTAVETGDTATAGTDFTAASGTLSIAAGGTMGTVKVWTKRDMVDDEEDETFTLVLSNPTNGTLDGGGTTLKASATIRNSTVPALKFGQSSVAIEEAGRAQIVLELDRPATTPIMVHWDTTPVSAEPDVDYDAAGGTVTFEVGETEVRFDIPLVNDVRLEYTEIFRVTLRPEDGTLVWIGMSWREYTIIDVDDAMLSMDVEMVVDEGAGSATITVSTAEDIDFAFELKYETAPGIVVPEAVGDPDAGYAAEAAALRYAAAEEGADYTRTAGTLTFAANEQSRTITVPLIDDRADEERELFQVWLLRTKELDRRIRHSKRPARVVIVDDDPPELSVADASAAEGSPVTFRVTLSGAATQDVTATWTASLETGDTAAAADFTDLAAATGTVTVMAGRTTATFPVATKEDTAEENHETFTVTLSSPSANAQLAPAATATGTINDDDDGTALPELSVTDATANEGDPLKFTVTQSAAAADDVTVNWTATLESGDTAESGAFGDLLETTGMVTVTAGQTTATVTVATRDDTADEEDETFTLTLSNAPGAVLGADSTATGTIVDDDARPVLSVAYAEAPEGQAVEFTVELSPASEKTVTVAWEAATLDEENTAAAGDFTAVSATTLTFMPGETEKTVTVQTTHDTVDEDDETFTVTLSNPSNATLRKATAKGAIVDDDASPTLGFEDDAEATEGDDVTFTVTLSPVSGRTVKVKVATSIESSDTAAAGDFTAVPATTLTFMPGETEKTVTVQTTADTNGEADETFTLTLSSPSNAALGDAMATATIVNDDSATLGVADASATEGSAVTFMVTLLPASTQTVTVNWAASVETGDTATAGTDFTAVSATTLTFMPGDTAKPVTVQTTHDTVDEANETFTVTLSNPSSDAMLATDPTATGTIDDDDDPPALGFEDDAEATEGSAVTFTVTLSPVSGREVTVEWATSVETGDTATAGTDFTAVPATTLTFMPGDTAQTVTVQTTADTNGEADETFTVTLSSLSNATLGDAMATATIVNDDSATLGVADATATEGSAVTFMVTLLPASTQTATVNWAASAETGDTATAGTDFTAVSATTLTFMPGETEKTVTVQTTHDTVDEDNETFTVTLSNPSSDAMLATDPTATGTIDDDDDRPTLGFEDDAEATEGSAVTFTVTLSPVSGREVTVDWATSVETGDTAIAGTDFTAVAATTLTFMPGDTEKPVTVQTTADTNGEADETFTVTLSSPSKATLGDEMATATILNDDSATLGFEDDAEATEGSAVTFTVTLLPASTQTVTVDWAASAETGDTAIAGTDFTAVAATTLTFMPGETEKTVTVQTTHDTVDEDNETFTVTLSNPSSDAMLATDPTATGTIDDDDGPPTLGFEDDAAATEGDDVTFTVTLSAASTQTVTVNWATSVETGDTATAGTDFTAVPATTLTFMPGETAQTVTVQTTEDTVDEDKETFTVTLSSPSSNATLAADPTATGTIVDGAPNAAPTAADGTVTTDEDTAYAFDASDFGFADTDTDDGLASVRVVTLPGSGTLAVSGSAVSADQEVAASDLGGNLTFTPAADGHGSGYASFTFRVSDGTDESAADYTMTIDVNAVNDAPSAGTVTIDDTAPMVGDELTASTADVADPDGLPDPFEPTWQWYRTPAGGAEAVISGAASATYTVVEADLDAALTAKASWTDLGGFANTLASAATSAVTATLPELSVADGSATEGSPVTFTVTLSAAAAENVTVNWAASVETGDTAIAGTDFTAVPATTLTFMPSDTTQTVTVQTTVDSTGEDKETFTVTLSSPSSNATLAADPTATGTIVDGDAPNAVPTAAAGTVTTDEDTAYAFEASDFGFVDTDTDDELASVRVVTLPGSGTLAVSGSAVSVDQEVAASDLGGNLTYTPAADGHGSGYASFTFRVSDGSAESAADYTMTIDVNAVNDAPSAGTVTIDATAPMVGDELTASTADVADPDGLPDPFEPTWQWYRTPAGGAEAVISGAASATYTVVEADLDAALTAKASWTDLGGFANTLASAATSAVTAPLPELSVADGSATEGEDVTFTVTLSAAAAENVTVNWATSVETGDTAIAGTDFTAVPATTLTFMPSDTTQTVTVQTTVDSTGEDKETFTVTLSSPSSNATLATDPTATGTIVDGDAPNAAPTAAAGTVTTNEDTAYAFGASDFGFVDTDTDDELASVRVVTLPGSGTLAVSGSAVSADQEVAASDLGGDLTFTPAADEHGSGYASFTFRVSDGTDESAADYTMTIDVNAVNDAPTVASALPDRSATVGEEFSYQVPEDAFSDVDGDTLSYAAAQDDDSALPEWLSFDATTRTFTGTAAAEDTGTVTVQVTASDGNGETASATFALEVTAAANAAPTAAAGTVTTDEDTAYAFGASDFGFADADTDDELASVRVVTLPGSGTLAVSGSAVSADQEVAASNLGGDLTFTPAADGHGSGYASFTFRVSDGTDESAADYTMTIDVTPVNDTPTAADGTVTTDEDTAYAFDASDFGFVDTDTGDGLASVRVVTLPGSGTLAVSGSAVSADQEVAASDLGGNLTFTPAADAHGSGYASFTFRVSDGSAESAADYTMTIDVNAVNDAPTAADQTVTTDEDTAYAFDASEFGFADADTGAELASVRVVTLPGSGTLAVSGSAVSADQEVAASNLGGDLTFTPAADGHGSGYASFTFRVSDGSDESAADYTMTIDVTSVNDAPSAGTVTIDDTAPVVGDELTATAAGIVDPDGLPAPLLLSWQWYGTRAGGSETEIAGATAATYLVRDADAGAALTAKATYQDSGGFANTLASAPTGAVGRAPVLSVGNASATEGQAVTFTVRLSAASTQAVTVDWAASAESGDTAGSGDFTTVSATTLIFTAGQTEKTVTVATTGDTLDEENETFTVRLTNATNATLPDPPTATGTIDDDDGAPVLSVGNASATEGRAVTFTVRLSAASGREVRVDWAASAESGDTAGSGDFTAANGALIFTAGQTEKGIRVATTGDSAAEENETFTLRLTNATNATLGTDPTATGTIDDDDDADATPPPPPPPVAPEVEATAGSYTSLEVRWTAPTGGPAVTGYELRYRERLLPVRAHRAAAHRQGGAWTEWPHGGTGTEATITGLQVNTAYEVDVRAVYGEVRSAWVRVLGRVPERRRRWGCSMTVVTAGADGMWSGGAGGGAGAVQRAGDGAAAGGMAQRRRAGAGAGADGGAGVRHRAAAGVWLSRVGGAGEVHGRFGDGHAELRLHGDGSRRRVGFGGGAGQGGAARRGDPHAGRGRHGNGRGADACADAGGAAGRQRGPRMDGGGENPGADAVHA